MKTSILLCCCAFAFSMTQGQIIHVPADYPTIQLGIDAANSGDTVLVADGLYYEQINFLGKKPLTVASEFLLDGDTSHISNTIIDGSQITNPDSASVVYFVSGEDTTSILCGCTISGGKGTYNAIISDYLQGGGILINNSGAKIRNNIIRDNIVNDTLMENSSGAYGAGIFSSDAGGNSWVIIENNEISHNKNISNHSQVGGSILTYSVNIRLDNNIISMNECQGLSDSTTAFSAGAICVSADYPPIKSIVHHNQIINNTLELFGSWAYGGGFETEKTLLSFSNNTISGNKQINSTPGTTCGAGIYCANRKSSVFNR